MIRRPPRSTLSSSSAASDVYKRQVVAVGAFGQGSDVGVGGFGSCVRDAVLVEGVPDQLLEPFDGAGEFDEFGESGAACPGDPPGEEFFSSAAFGGEHGAELFLEQVRPVQRGVGGLDPGQAQLLVCLLYTSPSPRDGLLSR